MKIFKQEMPFMEFVAMVFIVLGALAIVIVMSVSSYESLFGEETEDIKEFAELLGGFVGSLWSLAGVLLFYAALGDQRKDLEEQRELMDLQIKEVVNQTTEFRKQSSTMAMQKIEGTFFQLLRFHNEIITSITLEIQDLDFATGESKIRSIGGRKSFVEYYDIYKRFFHVQFENLHNPTTELLQRAVNTSYTQFYNEYQADLGHYFRNIYNVLKFVDGLAANERHFYLSLLLAQLSNYELALLFFHGLYQNNEDLKRLLEEYTILETAPRDEIISMTRKLYDPKAFHPEGLEIKDDEDDYFQAETFDEMKGLFGDSASSSGDLLSGLANQPGFGSSPSPIFSDDEDDDAVESSLLSKLGNLKKKDDNLQKKEVDFAGDLLSKVKSITANKPDNIVESFLPKDEKIEQEDSFFNDDLFSRMQKLQSKNENKNDDDIDDDLTGSLLDKLKSVKKEAPMVNKPVKDFDFNDEDIDDDLTGSLLDKLKSVKKEAPMVNMPVKDFDFNDEDIDDDLTGSLLDKLKSVKKEAPMVNKPVKDFDFNDEDIDDDLTGSLLDKLKSVKKEAPMNTQKESGESNLEKKTSQGKNLSSLSKFVKKK